MSGEGLGIDQAALKVKAVQFRFTPAFDLNKVNDGWTLVSDTKAKKGSFEFNLVDFFQEGELEVNGERMVERVKDGLGQRHAEAMLRKKDVIPIEQQGHVLVFTGTIWSDSTPPIGDRYVPCLYFKDDIWKMSFGLLSLEFHRWDRAVVRRSKSTLSQF